MPPLAAEGVGALELDDEVQALVDQSREGVRGIEADGTYHRHDLFGEILAHPRGLRLGPLRAPPEAQPLLLECRDQRLVENMVLAFDLLVRDARDFGQYLARRQAIGTALLAGQSDLVLEARHTNLEELVQIGGEDQQKHQPVEQWMRRIQGLLEHADIELQMRQLAIEIQRWIVKIGLGKRRGLGVNARARAVDAKWGRFTGLLRGCIVATEGNIGRARVVHHELPVVAGDQPLPRKHDTHL